MTDFLSWLGALWRRWSGPSVVSPEEIEAALHLPVVAIIPHLERRKSTEPQQGPRTRRIDLEGRWSSRLLIHFPEHSPAALAYESLVKEILERSRTRRQKVWLLAGTVSGEGASLSCVNLAIAAQRRNVKTLVVEAHTRSPRISRALSLELQPGLSGCLQRSINLSIAVRASETTGVRVLPAGPVVAYPEMQWGTPAFHRLLAEMRSLYDVVFVEGPPILLYPDVTTLADKVDGIIIINQYGRTPPERVRKSIQKLGERQDILLGVLLNDVPLR